MSAELVRAARHATADYITALMVDGGENVQACEQAMNDAFDALVAENETLRALMRRVLSGEPWGAYANDGSGRTFEDEFRAAARGGDAT
jgi:hypothetical protein